MGSIGSILAGADGLARFTTWIPALEAAKARSVTGSNAGISAPPMPAEVPLSESTIELLSREVKALLGLAERLGAA